MHAGPIPLPSPESLVHRARLAKLVTPLKRVRAKVPFYQLAAHRIPTLWSLYRGLLKHAPAKEIKFRIRMLFRRHQYLTSPPATRAQLQKSHKWLDIFLRAKQGDTRLQAILSRYARMIAIKREKEAWKRKILDAFSWEAKLRSRSIFKGSFIRQSLYNTLLPRLSPQPKHISGMIHKRRQKRHDRYQLKELLSGWTIDLRSERAIEESLLKQGADFQPSYHGFLDEWEKPILQKQHTINQTLARDWDRLTAPYPQELLKAGLRARRENILNKTRERQREQRGEILAATLRRRRKGPPAHVLSRMTDKQRRLDAIARSPSEVGYVAMAKKQLGHKLRSPDAWKAEHGGDDVEKLDRLHQIEREIKLENERRRSNGLKVNGQS